MLPLSYPEEVCVCVCACASVVSYPIPLVVTVTMHQVGNLPLLVFIFLPSLSSVMFSFLQFTIIHHVCNCL